MPPRARLVRAGRAGRPDAPWYVVDKVMHGNTLVVSQSEEDLMSQWLAAGETNWLVPTPTRTPDSPSQFRSPRKRATPRR